MQGALALLLVISGDLALIAARGRRGSVARRRAGPLALAGLALILGGIVLGLSGGGSVGGVLAAILGIADIAILGGSLVLFLRRAPVAPPEIDPRALADAVETNPDPADARGRRGPGDDGEPVADDADAERPIRCVLTKEDEPPGGLKVEKGSKFALLLPKNVAWTFIALADPARLTLAFRVQAEEFSPLTAGYLATVPLGLGVIGGAGYQALTGDNPYTSNYEVADQLVFDIVCDSECKAYRRHVSGKRSDHDGPLAADIGPSVREVGNDIRFNPEMICVLGDGWSFGASAGISGMGLSGGVSLSYSPADLTSSAVPLGTFVWKCVSGAEAG